MYDYQMVKSIHDQRMHQYHIEAERAHLLRMLAKRRTEQGSRPRPLEVLAVALRQMVGRRPQPAT